ncbi:hypothetical protein [Neobacillus niacini]|uniref:hypothetical protein n=1 Tax=Neobacillus niacini TaxID=86668 RepID=UPI0028618624|nr:hypothetical protein [Neobacillus niacini]MDR7002026.1 uncharacterized protein YcfL [Neobacillus niacini]
MKEFKKWLLVLMASFMLVGVASGCSGNNKKTDANTQQNQNDDSSGSQDNGTGTDQSGQ